jgi:hypothetical protein
MNVPATRSNEAEVLAKRWFPKAFRFRNTSFILLSTKDLGATQQECSRLLQDLHIGIIASQSLLKCTLRGSDGEAEHGVNTLLSEAATDTMNILQGAASLQFRVRVSNSSKLDVAAGYPTSMALILENGERGAFQAICDALRRDWYYDVLPTPTLALLSMTA